jgi:hypothetical protein
MGALMEYEERRQLDPLVDVSLLLDLEDELPTGLPALGRLGGGTGQTRQTVQVSLRNELQDTLAGVDRVPEYDPSPVLR